MRLWITSTFDALTLSTAQQVSQVFDFVSNRSQESVLDLSPHVGEANGLGPTYLKFTVYILLAHLHCERVPTPHHIASHGVPSLLLVLLPSLLLLLLVVMVPQAAAGPSVFSLLRQQLCVGYECFASPLNAHFGRFGSAFPDVDAPFGSGGSFFRFVC
jgi:hypothetical protein